MEYATIDVDVSDRIMTITLSRPDHLNAFTVEMLRELLDVFDRADADDDVRAVIVTGAGRAFCAGADLSAGAQTFDYLSMGEGPSASDPPPRPVGDASGVATSAAALASSSSGPSPDSLLGEGTASSSGSSPTETGGSRELRDGGGLLTLRIFRCTKPVIAAINGPAVGVGATMTLPMDIRLAADSARFGFVFAARGIVPEAASSWFLPRLVGISQALEWCYSAKVFPAADALAGGLVRSLHPADELLDAARSLATDIVATSAPVSVALTRMMMWRMLGASHPMEAHRIDSRGVNHLGRSPDAREGIEAFFEKRAANWTMSVADDLPSFVPWWTEPTFE